MPQQFQAQPIEAKTKGEVKRLRKSGWIPISVQHKGEETIHLQQETRPLEDFIRQHGESALLELEVAPNSRRETVLLHGLQRDPLTHHLIQVTFQRVVRGEMIKAHVPLVFHGEPEAIRNHTAIAQHSIEQVEVQCKSENIPTHISVDISHLNFGDSLRVADLPPSDKYEIITPADTMMVSLSSTITQETEETLTEAPAEATATGEEAAG